jgi:pimeloyl-ACP methyl ester carboxylesterase
MEVKVGDSTIYYEEVGTGRPLLMLHGWPADHRGMVYDMEPFFANRSGWRRLYPDLPGMGRTGAVDWVSHQDQVLEVVIAFMDAVARLNALSWREPHTAAISLAAWCIVWPTELTDSCLRYPSSRRMPANDTFRSRLSSMKIRRSSPH